MFGVGRWGGGLSLGQRQGKHSCTDGAEASKARMAILISENDWWIIPKSKFVGCIVAGGVLLRAYLPDTYRICCMQGTHITTGKVNARRK
jgi:hypothetical protein